MSQRIKEPTLVLPQRFLNDYHWSQQQNQLSQQNHLINFQENQQTINQDEQKFLQQVGRGLKIHAPELIEEGEGGSYFLKSIKGRILAVFKPADEDPYSPRNPKLQGRPPLEQRKGILPGESPQREVAAYLLDHQHFANVPLTLRVRLNHPHFCGPVEGSLQRYQKHDLASWDLGPSAYDKYDVQKIALFDLRLLNTDRHGGNILVRRVDYGKNSSRYKLIPIDHGMCLPDHSLKYEELYFEWENWPQANTPIDMGLRRYVEDLDLWADVKVLRGIGIREECIRIMVLSSTLLKVTVARGYSPAAIAQIMRRVGDEMRLEDLLPNLSGPAVLSSLLFRVTEWVESSVPRLGFKPDRRRGSTIIRSKDSPCFSHHDPGTGLNVRPPLPVSQRFFNRQNSAPVILLP